MPIAINHVTPIHFNNQLDSTTDFVTDTDGTRKYYDTCTLTLQQPILVTNCEVKLETLAIYHSWYAISDENKNNTFQIIFDDVYISQASQVQVVFNIVLPDGSYEITDINDALQAALVSYGLFMFACTPSASAAGGIGISSDVIVPLEIATNAVQAKVALITKPWGIPLSQSPLGIDPAATTPVNFYNYITPLGWANSSLAASIPTLGTWWGPGTAPTAVNQILTNAVVINAPTSGTKGDYSALVLPTVNSRQPRFRIPAGFGSVIGFPAGDYPSAAPTTNYPAFYNPLTDITTTLSLFPPQITLYNSIIIGCNLVKEVVNPYYPDFLYSINPNVRPGDLVSSINLATFRKAQDGTYSTISIRLYTENNQLLPIRDPNRNFTITIQPIEGNGSGVGNPGTYRDSIGYSHSQPNQTPLAINEEANQVNIQNFTNKGRTPSFPRDLPRSRLPRYISEATTGGGIRSSVIHGHPEDDEDEDEEVYHPQVKRKKLLA